MRLRMPRHALAAALLTITTATALAGCGTASARPATAPELTNLTVMAVPAEGAAGLYIAQDDGLFQKAGLHVTIKSTENPTADIPALLHGSVDVLSGQYTTYIAATAAGVAKMRILAAGYALGPQVQEIMSPPHSRLATPAQLRGKTIAVNAVDSVTTDLLYTALAPYRIAPGQVHVVAIPFPVMPAALAAGRVGAIYEVEPYVSEAAERYGDYDLVRCPETFVGWMRHSCRRPGSRLGSCRRTERWSGDGRTGPGQAADRSGGAAAAADRAPR